jgi:hypothetical protein
MLSSNFSQSGTALTPMNSPALSSNANCARADASRASRMWRDYAKNTVGRRPMRQKKFGKGSFGLRPLQPPEITQNRQSFLWKSLEENRRGLEKLGEKAGRAFISPSLFPPGNAAAPIANWCAIRLSIHILRLVLFLAGAGKGPRAHEMWLRSLSALLLRRARGAPDGKTESPGNGAATA